MSEPELKELNPETALQHMTDEEFINFSKCGFNYIVSEENKLNTLRKGSVIRLDGEIFKLNSNINEIVDVFDEMNDNELISMLMNEFANIGMNLVFLSLSDKDILTKADENGFPLTESEMKKERQRELKLIKNTAYLLRKIVEKNSTRLGLDLTKEVEIKEE